MRLKQNIVIVESSTVDKSTMEINMDFQSFNLILKYAKDYGHRRIRDAGVSDTEHKICTFLYFHSAVSQDAVASALMMDKTTVAKALLSLEKKDCVSRIRNPNNRRENVLSITEKGKNRIAEVLDVYDKWLENVMACLSETEQELFFSFYKRILNNAKLISEEKKNE